MFDVLFDDEKVRRYWRITMPITPCRPAWKGTMTARERFNRQMHYQPVDRCFNMEFGYWQENFTQWRSWNRDDGSIINSLISAHVHRPVTDARSSVQIKHTGHPILVYSRIDAGGICREPEIAGILRDKLRINSNIPAASRRGRHAVVG